MVALLMCPFSPMGMNFQNFISIRIQVREAVRGMYRKYKRPSEAAAIFCTFKLVTGHWIWWQLLHMSANLLTCLLGMEQHPDL
jgi:hypothetical protein